MTDLPDVVLALRGKVSRLQSELRATETARAAAVEDAHRARLDADALRTANAALRKLVAWGVPAPRDHH